MKKSIFAFGFIVFFGAHTFAGPGQIGSANNGSNESFGIDSLKSFACLSKRSIQGISEIQNIPAWDADAGTKRYLMMQEGLAIESEILACSAANQRISKDEARYTISELTRDRNLKIDRLTQEAVSIQGKLQSESLPEIKRNSYEARLETIAQQIDQIATETETLRIKIEKSVSIKKLEDEYSPYNGA